MVRPNWKGYKDLQRGPGPSSSHMFSNWRCALDPCISTCFPTLHVAANSSETLFPFKTFHSPFNDHREPVSRLLDRSLCLKTAFVRYLSPQGETSTHYPPFSLLLWKANLVMGHLVDLAASDADQEVVWEQTCLLGQAVLHNLGGCVSRGNISINYLTSSWNDTMH